MSSIKRPNRRWDVPHGGRARGWAGTLVSRRKPSVMLVFGNEDFDGGVVRSASLLPLALMALTVAWRAAAASYYVNDASTVGDVAFPGCPVMGLGSSLAACGSCAQPCNSPQRAYTNLALTAGDTVYLNTGVYAGASNQPLLDVNDPVKAGTAVNPLTFAGPAGSDGRAALGAGGVPLALLDGSNNSTAGIWIRVNGIRLMTFGIANIPGGACTAFGPCGSGVRITLDSLVTSFEVTGLDVYGLGGSGANSVDIDQGNTTCVRCVVENNTFHDSPNGDSAIWLGGLNGVVIRGNEVRGNGLNSGGPAIALEGCSNATVVNNLVTGNGGAALRTYRYSATGLGSDALRLENNTFRRNQQMVGIAVPVAELMLVTGSGHVLENNVLAANTGAVMIVDGGMPLTSNFNGYFVEGGATLGTVGGTPLNGLADLHALGRDVNSLLADPQFVASNDHRLRSTAGRPLSDGGFAVDANTSPLLNRGNPAAAFANELPPNGARVDLGAYGNTAKASFTPVQLQVAAGDAQTAAPGTALPALLEVSVVEQLGGAAAAGVQVDFEVMSGGGSVSPASALTNALGRATTQATLGTSEGANTFRATLPKVGGGGIALFTSTAAMAASGGVGPGAGLPGGGAGAAETLPSDELARALAVRCGCSAGEGALGVGAWGAVLAAGWLRRRSARRR